MITLTRYCLFLLLAVGCVGCATNRAGTDTDAGTADLTMPTPVPMDAARPPDLSVGPDLAQPVRTGEWTEYWLLGQLPAQSTVYLYARYGAQVTFRGTNAQPMMVTLPADTFVSYNVAALGYQAVGTQWYFMEAISDAPLGDGSDFMMSADRMVTTYQTIHGDALHDKPGHGLKKHVWFADGQSGPSDDQLVMYAPQTAHVTVRSVSNSGEVATRTVDVTGLLVTGSLEGWLSPLSTGYGLEVTSDQPIAVAMFDELGTSSTTTSGSGYYFGDLGQSELYDEYMHIQDDSAPATPYRSFYTPAAASLTFTKADGTAAGTKSYMAETSEFSYDAACGYDVAARPYLVHYKASRPVADWGFNMDTTPVATDMRAGASYMGWNASLARLQIYAPQDAHITIYDGRTISVRKTLTLPGSTVSSIPLDSIGFAASQPFLVTVASDVTLFQEVLIANSYVRQYPSEIGPQIQ